MSDRITIPLYQTGWSSEAPLLDKGAGHLLACKNYIIRQNLVESRQGHFLRMAHTSPVQTLIAIEEYNILIACAGDSIYVYQSDDAGDWTLIKTQSGFSTANWRWVYVNHTIIMVNGQDKAQMITVTDAGEPSQTVNIADWAVTGTNSIIFAWISVLNAQVVAGFGNDLTAWYLKPGYIQGELSEFNLGTSSGTPKKGGNIIGGFNINRDAGTSLNAYIGFLTDNGEAVVYNGNDLGDATTLQYNGTYQTGYPLGWTPFINWSGDLIIMTNKGFISAHSIFANGENQSAQYIFSQRINTWLLEQYAKFGTEQGFYGIVVPTEDIVLFNIPQGGNTFVQVCMNITSGKWSLWTGIDAFSMCMFGGKLLFGKADGVYEYGTSSTDTSFIALELWTSYNNCGSDLLKRLNMLQLRHSSSDKINLAFAVYKDFENQSYYNWVDTSGVIDSIGSTGFIWSNYELPNDPTPGTAYWSNGSPDEEDTAYWAGGYGDMTASAEVFSTSGLGHNFSVKITANVQGIKHQVVDLMLLFNTSKTAI